MTDEARVPSGEELRALVEKYRLAVDKSDEQFEAGHAMADVLEALSAARSAPDDLREAAVALAERAGIDLLDDHDLFIDDLTATLAAAEARGIERARAAVRAEKEKALDLFPVGESRGVALAVCSYILEALASPRRDQTDGEPR